MTNSGHILIIDDDPAFVTTYRQMFEKQGLQVTAAHTVKIEEIDITVENNADDAPWKNDGASYLLGECKNWSKPCGSGELRNFYAKLTTKYQRARTGFFFAPGGFTPELHEARREHAKDGALVIPVDGDDLERWIEADDRAAVLRDLHKRAVLGTNR